MTSITVLANIRPAALQLRLAFNSAMAAITDWPYGGPAPNLISIDTFTPTIEDVCYLVERDIGGEDMSDSEFENLMVTVGGVSSHLSVPLPADRKYKSAAQTLLALSANLKARDERSKTTP